MQASQQLSVENIDTMNLVKALSDIGLKDKESKVYLALLELGPSLVSVLSRKAGTNRVSTYHVLGKLMEGGYVTQMINKEMKYFAAVDPVLIVEQVNARAQRVSSALEELKNLQNMYQKKAKTHHFQGLNGIKAMIQDTLLTPGPILNFSYSQKIREQWPEYDDEYICQRIRRKISIKCICPMDSEVLKIKGTDREAYRETRIIPLEEFPLACEINIYADKTAFMSFEPNDLFGIIIENENFTSSHRYMFNMAWKMAATSSTNEVISSISSPAQSPIPNLF